MNTKPSAETSLRHGQVILQKVLGFEALVGQKDCVQRLKTFGELYSAKNEVPEHILLTGNSGMGKRTLAKAFAREFNQSLIELDARECQKKGDLTAILTGLEPRGAFLIANIQDLPRPVTEVLQHALEHYQIQLVIGVGARERICPFKLDRFTFFGTAPRVADVPRNLLNCFTLSLTLQPYTSSELQRIAVSLATGSGINLSDDMTPLLASASQRTPKSIEQLLLRLARLGKTQLTREDAVEAFAAFGLVARPIATPLDTSALDNLSGVEFEKLILALLQRMGFRAEMTRTTGDGGIDIVAVLDKPIVGGRYLIQCKRFTDSLVGAPTVREFYGAVVADKKAVKGILITTSGFTQQAREFAENLHIELIDRPELTSLLSEVDPGTA